MNFSLSSSQLCITVTIIKLLQKVNDEKFEQTIVVMEVLHITITTITITILVIMIKLLQMADEEKFERTIAILGRLLRDDLQLQVCGEAFRIDNMDERCRSSIERRWRPMRHHDTSGEVSQIQ